MEDRVVKLTQKEQRKKKIILKTEDFGRWDNIKHNNVCIIEVLGEERKEQKNYLKR